VCGGEEVETNAQHPFWDNFPVGARRKAENWRISVALPRIELRRQLAMMFIAFLFGCDKKSVASGIEGEDNVLAWFGIGNQHIKELP
jgi:hypothetical protein